MPQIIPVSPWVADHCGLIPSGAEVLDLACGSGRHTRLLASLGCRVLAVDRNEEALSFLRDVPAVETRAMDLETAAWPLSGERFAGVIVTNYLWRPHLANLLACLAPGGVLIYETFMLGNEAYGKPSSPAFLLRPGELREVVIAAGLEELAWVEGYTAVPKPAMRQAIVAKRPI
jgi:SAM-dependent methyltransferase